MNRPILNNVTDPNSTLGEFNLREHVYTEDELSSIQFSQQMYKGKIEDDGSVQLSNVSPLSIYVSTEETYNSVVDRLDEKAIYLVESEFLNGYNRRVINVCLPTEESDGANKEYVDARFDTMSSTIESELQTKLRAQQLDETIELSVNSLKTYIDDVIAAQTEPISVISYYDSHFIPNDSAAKTLWSSIILNKLFSNLTENNEVQLESISFQGGNEKLSSNLVLEVYKNFERHSTIEEIITPENYLGSSDNVVSQTFDFKVITWKFRNLKLNTSKQYVFRFIDTNGDQANIDLRMCVNETFDDLSCGILNPQDIETTLTQHVAYIPQIKICNVKNSL